MCDFIKYRFKNVLNVYDSVYLFKLYSFFQSVFSSTANNIMTYSQLSISRTVKGQCSRHREFDLSSIRDIKVGLYFFFFIFPEKENLKTCLLALTQVIPT